MYKSICALILAGLLCACSSSGDLVDESEEYKGPQTAAVAPVSDRRSRQGPLDEGIRVDVQHSIQHQLDRSGIFAGVLALDRSDEGNEAEVIIQPALIESAGHGTDNVELRVLVTEKTKRRIILDRHYEGGNRTNALQVAIRELEEDLEHCYAR